MKRTLMLAALALAVLAALPVAAFAQEPPPGPPDGGPHMGPPPDGGPPMGPPPAFWENEQIVKALGLTEKQLAALDAVGAAMEERHEAIRTALHAAHRELDKALKAKTIDQAKVRQLGAALAEQEVARVNLMIEERLQVAQILTAEQRTKLQTMRPRHGGPGHSRNR